MSVPLVCDYGSGFCKVGFSGTEAPEAVFPTILGKLRHDNQLVGLDEEDWFIGEEVQRQRDKLILQYPITRATIANWDDMEKIWHHSFYQLLHTAPEQHPLMLTEPPLNTMSNKEKVLEVRSQVVGMTIESGEGMTYFVPITDGCPLHQSTVKMEMAGQDITWYLLQLLSERGHSFMGTGDREYIRDMKEKCCYVALDFDKEKMEAQSPPPTQKYLLPDGQEIDLGPERFSCPEVLFQADLMGRHSLGIHMTAFRSVSSCSPALWKSLFGHVVLSGGTGSCSGLRSRMQRELSALVSPSIRVKVYTCPYSIYGAWVGGSILCSLSSFKNMWVTSNEYKDIGSSVINRRAF